MLVDAVLRDFDALNGHVIEILATAVLIQVSSVFEYVCVRASVCASVSARVCVCVL